MANEFRQLPNPDNIPGAVSSGYQRQNTNLYAVQTGLDTCEPYDNGEGVITVPAGGIVEYNGVMFRLNVDMSITKPNPAMAYWLAVTDNEDGFATLEPVTRPGAWNPAKQGCYRADGRRTLNWASLGALSDLVEEPIFSKTVKGSEIIQLPHGWHWAELTSGAGNGAASGQTGGTANETKTVNFHFLNQDGLLQVKVGGSGGKGGNGGNGGNGYNGGGKGGGGAGSGGGEETTLTTPHGVITTGRVNPGAGAPGGYGASNAGGGGGGGGVIGGYGGETNSSAAPGISGGVGGGKGGRASTSAYGGYGGGFGGNGSNGDNAPPPPPLGLAEGGAEAAAKGSMVGINRTEQPTASAISIQLGIKSVGNCP
jgi:hypothetical protein